MKGQKTWSDSKLYKYAFNANKNSEKDPINMEIIIKILINMATVGGCVFFFDEEQLMECLRKLSSHAPVRALRSNDRNRLRVNIVRTAFGSRAFSLAAPAVWNILPHNLLTFLFHS